MADPIDEVFKLAQQARKPSYYLKKQGRLVSLGTASLDQAQIVLLPEVHDDKDSLLNQFLILAREQQIGRDFIVLDESLKAMEQSKWELFSEKAVEIIAAQHKKSNYSVKDFETNLQKLATKLRKQPDLLNYVRDPGLWTLKPFSAMSTTFFGWDRPKHESLYDRNLELVKTLNKLIPRYQRIFVMLGARHVPELDYLLSKHVLCPSNKYASPKDFFASVSNTDNLAHGTGSSAPIYQFLSKHSYAVVFNHNLYSVLQRISQEFDHKKSPCINLKKGWEQILPADGRSLGRSFGPLRL